MKSSQANRCKVPAAFWRAMERQGITPAALLRQAKLPATLHVPGQGLVTTDQFFALWRAIEQLSKDTEIGLTLAQSTDTSLNHPSLLTAFYAKDFRDGLKRVARFKQLCTPEKLHLEEEGGRVKITTEWPHATSPEPGVSVDVTMTIIVELGRRGTGQQLVPALVELTRADPKNGHHRKYFGCEIRFGADQDALYLWSTDLDRPFPGHNPEMLEMLTPALSAALQEIAANSSVSEQVKIVLKRRMASGRPDLADIARELGTSERTLQRRITDDGTSYRQLLEEARRELGRQMLGNSGSDVEEIAYLLGYQDTSSFYRAFREWEGVTPNQWREHQTTKPNKLH
jgi:AraC-like DNA-binding protein